MRKISLFFVLMLALNLVNAQDTTVYKLKLALSLVDFPQNFQSEAKYPSMIQSVELSNDLYDLSFWGIDALGNLIIKNKQKSGKRKRNHNRHLKPNIEQAECIVLLARGVKGSNLLCNKALKSAKGNHDNHHHVNKAGKSSKG